MAMNETIGFIGSGSLGLPMATNLLARGFALRVYNRTADKAAPLVARGAEVAARPADVAARGGVVVSVVWDDAALESIATSDGFLERLGPGGLHVSSSTVSPDTAARLADLHARHGVAYVDAPIFGRPEAVVARQLVVPMSGAPAAKARARPVLEGLGASHLFDFGERAGAAVLVKLIGNFLIVSASRSMTEGIAVARESGVDPALVIEMLTTTLFAAPIFQSHGKRLIDGAPPLRGGIPEKDISLILGAAHRAGVAMPIACELLDLVKA